MKSTGRYIVIEGQDGTGKSTQAKLLVEYLRKTGQTVLGIHEPGGGLASTTEIRRILKDKTYQLDPVSIVLLFAANRRELWVKTIEPALARGETVVSDRNWLSTLAYEHYGFGVPAEVILQIHRQSLPDRYLYPDTSLILAIDDDVRRRRLQQRDDSSQKDTFESQRDDFQARVIDGYQQIAKDYNAKIVDASGTPEQIHSEMLSTLKLT
ncbi:thymidylate kinase [Alphaproteobacteria bacterium]|nr:thymidylate kinase [Alphaproteobacteria bacterium]